MNCGREAAVLADRAVRSAPRRRAPDAAVAGALAARMRLATRQAVSRWRPRGAWGFTRIRPAHTSRGRESRACWSRSAHDRISRSSRTTLPVGLQRYGRHKSGPMHLGRCLSMGLEPPTTGIMCWYCSLGALRVISEVALRMLQALASRHCVSGRVGNGMLSSGQPGNRLRSHPPVGDGMALVQMLGWGARSPVLGMLSHLARRHGSWRHFWGVAART